MYLKGEVVIFCLVGLIVFVCFWVGVCGGLGNLILFVFVFKFFVEVI